MDDRILMPNLFYNSIFLVIMNLRYQVFVFFYGLVHQFFTSRFDGCFQNRMALLEFNSTLINVTTCSREREPEHIMIRMQVNPYHKWD